MLSMKKNLNDFPVISQFITMVKLGENFPNSSDELHQISKAISERLNLTIVKEDYHKFSPIGITFVSILAQSHLVLHTWPEFQMLHIDLVSCSGSLNEDLVRDTLQEIFSKNNILYFNLKEVKY